MGGKDLKYLQWLCGFCSKVTLLVVFLVFSFLLLRLRKKPLDTGFHSVLDEWWGLSKLVLYNSFAPSSICI